MRSLRTKEDTQQEEGEEEKKHGLAKENGIQQLKGGKKRKMNTYQLTKWQPLGSRGFERESLILFYFFTLFTYLINFISRIQLKIGRVSCFGHIDNSFKVQAVARVSHHMPIMLQC